MITTEDFKPLFDGQSHLDASGRERLPLLLQQAVDERSNIDSLSGGIEPIALPAGVGKWDRPVSLRNKSIRVIGSGMMSTGLSATRSVPFFMCHPAAHGLPHIVTGQDGSKRLRLHGTMADGHMNLSDVNWADFAALNAVRFRWRMRFKTLPAEGDSQTVIGCSGSLDGSTAGHSDATCIPFFLVWSGVLKIRLFSQQDGQPDYADIPLPASVGADTENLYEVLIDGPLRELRIDGQLIATHTTTFNNPTRKPWEDIWVGARPAGGWPEGWVMERTVDAEVWDVSVSQGGSTLEAINLADVDGLCVGVTGVYGSGCVLWRQGDYAGDVGAAGVSGLNFVGGTFGIYGCGMHHTKLEDLASFATRYPIYLKSHSFQNEIRGVVFIVPRVGITATQISDPSIYNAQIFGSAAFSVVAKESPLDIHGSWFYGSAAGEVLAKGGQVTVSDSWLTDEGAGRVQPYKLLFANCPNVELRQVQFYARMGPTKPVAMIGCKSGSLRNIRFDVGDSAPTWLHLEGPAPLNKISVGGINHLSDHGQPSGGTLTNQPGWVKSLDEAPA